MRVDEVFRRLLLACAALAACEAPAYVPPTAIAPPVAPPAPSLAASTCPLTPSPTPPSPATASTASPPPPPPPRPAGAYADIDPDDDDVPGPPDVLPDCEEQLARAGVKFRRASLPVHAERKLVCGAPQVVVYERGPGNIVYAPAPLLTCPMALAIASFERIVQQQAAAIYASAVVRVDQLGTYNCREMAAYPGWVSEHAYANAIDLARFTLRNGQTIEVKRDFDQSAEPPARKAGALLRTVSQRAYDEQVFSHVLTPFFDAHHRDHLHLDLARYRGDGTRRQP